MARANLFLDTVLARLTPLGDVRARAMFGGHGLYYDGIIFALIADDRLYFKTDAETRPRFTGTSGKPFSFRSARGLVQTSYYEIPPRILNSAQAIKPWLELALIAARGAARTKKQAKSKIGNAGRRPAKRVVKLRP